MSASEETIVQKVRERSRFSLRAVFDYFKKEGLNPVLNGDELIWEAQGKMNIMRLANGCQLQVPQRSSAPQSRNLD